MAQVKGGITKGVILNSFVLFKNPKNNPLRNETMQSQLNKIKQNKTSSQYLCTIFSQVRLD